MQKDSAQSDVVWGLCAELLASSDPCLVGQGAATLRSLLGIPAFRQALARASQAKCGVGSALPHMASWSPAIRSIHTALQLLFAEHSDERVLRDVLASLHMLLSASFGGDSVISVCVSGGPGGQDNSSVSLWQLVNRLSALSLHTVPSLACDAVVALSLLTSNAAGAAVCVLHRAAPLLLWQVMCRCLQAISIGSEASDSKDAVESQTLEPFPVAASEQLPQQVSYADEPQQQETTLTPPHPSAKVLASRNFMLEIIHGSCEHSFVVGCNLTCDDFIRQPGVAEFLLYCSMNACINCCTVCMSMKRTHSTAAHASPATSLLSCSFGCTVYVQRHCELPAPHSTSSHFQQIFFRPRRNDGI
jgi:hypothetical protein